MDNVIIVAIITGSASLVAVVISSIVAITSTRRNIRANKELETQRHLLASYRERDEISKQTMEKRIEFLGQACSTVQLIRDDIRLIQTTKAQDINALRRFVNNSEKLAELYAHSHFILGTIERSILHDTRALARMSTFPLVDHRSKIDNELNEDFKPYSKWWEELKNLLETMTTAQKYLISEHARLTDIIGNMPPPNDINYQSLLPHKFVKYGNDNDEN